MVERKLDSLFITKSLGDSILKSLAPDSKQRLMTIRWEEFCKKLTLASLTFKLGNQSYGLTYLSLRKRLNF